MTRRDGAALALALSAGIAIALIDSRPTWDDTATTAGALGLTGGLAAFVSGARPWIWALLVGIWTPAIQVLSRGDPASLLAIGFAALGAATGWWLATQAGRGGTPSTG